MDLKKVVRNALESGRTALTEVESKSLLAEYGVPVVAETVVASAGDAVAAALDFGLPVVLKGLSEAVLHKTEHGLVHLNLTDEKSISTAAEQIIQTAPGAKILVQPQVRGSREFVAGLFRDPNFGPAILFGLGGIFTEVLADVVFRLAPLTPQDALEMIASIRAHSLLEAFRGEAAVNRTPLAQTLMGLSAIAADFPEIAEIDINPLIAAPDGTVRAVDALITLAPAREPSENDHPVPPAAIQTLFHPRSLAFIGASSQMGKWGHRLICNAVGCGYKGKVYAVNPKGGVIAGRPAFKSVTDIPDVVDLAVVTVPAASVLGLIPQLQAKGIKNLLLITSGFGETGADGRILENQLVQTAREAGILVLGPNTMGICNPHIDFFCMGATVSPLAGSTAMISQSGNLGTQLLAFAEEHGIGIRVFAGSGNEAMLTMADYLESLAKDDLTDTIMLYVESIKQGRRFFESARRLSRKKPIVLLKGGQTRAGNRAAASHTGAMASDARVFDAACRQAGIVKVDQPMELLDLSAAFSSLPLPSGNRVAIMTLGGGWGVVTADLCNRFGLVVPDLSPELIARIDQVLPPFWSRTNPIDLVGDNDLSMPLTVMEALLQWEGCDAVIHLGILGRQLFLRRLADAIEQSDPSYTHEALDSAVMEMVAFEKNYIKQIVRMMGKYGKPAYGVSLLTDRKTASVYPVAGSKLKGVYYETPERAVKTVARMVAYQRFRSQSTGQ